MLFDTDILIWIQRGRTKAAELVDKADDRLVSMQTYMELLQCAQNKKQHQVTKAFLSDYGFIILPLTEQIGHRASIYIEEYTLSTGLRVGDALIAATAVSNNLTLCTSNKKHYKSITDLQLKIFNP